MRAFVKNDEHSMFMFNSCRGLLALLNFLFRSKFYTSLVVSDSKGVTALSTVNPSACIDTPIMYWYTPGFVHLSLS